MIRKRTVTRTVPAALITPVVLAAAIVVPAMAALFAGCDTPYSSPNWPYGSGGGHTGGGGGSTPLSMDTPPGVITHLAALTGNGTVTFVWLDPADDDLDHIEIWFGTSPLATSGTVLPSAARGAMTAAWNGAPGDVLYYHFIAVDTAGNRSAVVNYVVTLTEIKAEVTNLVGMITGADSVKLTWTDPVSPAFYEADITHDQGGGLDVAPKGTEQSAWNGLSTGTAYTFTVKALSSGSTSGVNVAMTLVADTTPPGAVSGLGAIDGGFGSVELNWTSPGDTDLQYVEITCEPFIGPAKTVSVSPGAAGTYTWNGLAGGVTYTFTVKAVDHSGNRSAGVTVSGTPLDTTPPGPVTDLEGVPGDGCIALIWTDPGDADLDYIQFEYGMGLQQTPGGSQAYTWNPLDNGTEYTFTVKAVDLNGNRSAAVTIGPLTPFAISGGNVTYAPVDGYPSLVWKIHTFDTAGTHGLDFSPAFSGPVTADYLIVAGGGGAGGDNPWSTSSGSSDLAGGGGAGGLLYKTGVTLSPSGGAVTVTVGGGGVGGGQSKQGQDGGSSAVGSVEVPGGGGGGGSVYNMNGRVGGSGGGGGAGDGSAHGNGGTRKSDDPDIKGYAGGNGNQTYGAGGGGAGSAGTSGRSTGGGAPWAAATEAPWIVTATGTSEFSRGGNSGGSSSPAGGKAGVNYGDGGSGGNNTRKSGGPGHSGIVVIRLKRPALAP